MIPFSITIQQAAAPHQSLAFLFWGAGVFGSARFRAVVLSVSNAQQQLPIGQPISVKLLGCGS
jgi:hypothetical protein